VAEEGEIDYEDTIEQKDMVITISHAGYIKRQEISAYRAQRRGGKGVIGARTKEDDYIEQLFIANTHAYLLFLTDKGRCYWLKVHEIPAASRTARGKPIINVVQMGEGEKLASILVTGGFEDGRFVFFVTRKGVVKRTDLNAFSNVRSAGIIALGVDDGDSLVAVFITDGTKDVLLSTAQGMSIRFAESEVRSMGRQAYGVKGITLDPGDEVVGADVVEPGTTILTVTANGYGKRTEESEYRVQGRGGKGIIDIKTTERNGNVVGLAQVKDRDEVMLVTNGGMLIRIKVHDISVIGRNTQGVRLISLESAGEKVSSISKLPESSEENGDASNGEDITPSTPEPQEPGEGGES